MKKLCVAALAVGLTTLGVSVSGIASSSAETPITDITYITDAPAKTQPYIKPGSEKIVFA